MPQPADAPSSAHRAMGWWVTGPLLVGVGTMLVNAPGIARVSPWTDELYTASVATRTVPDIWRMSQHIEASHAFYGALVHLWIAGVGVSPLSIRLPSLVAAGVAGALVFELVRRLTDGRTAVVAAAVFAILPRTTWMAIEARSYALTCATAALATLLLVRMLARPTLLRGMAYALAVMIGVWLNIYLVLILVAHAAVLVRRLRERRLVLTWVASASLALLGALPILLVVMSQSTQVATNRLGLLALARSVVVNQWFLGETPTQSGGTGGDGLWRVAAVALAAVVCALAVHGVSRLWVEGRREALLLLAAWAVAPTVVAVGVWMMGPSVYNPRYLTFTTPPVAGLAAAGILALRPRQVWLATLLVVACVIPVYLSQRQVNAKSGGDWSEVVAFVQQHRTPAQAVYYAPRARGPGSSGQRTSRPVGSLYPEVFGSMKDVTLVRTAAQEGDLSGVSRDLIHSLGVLSDVHSVVAIYAVDDEHDVADRAHFARVSFEPTGEWAGPLNRVVLYERRGRAGPG